MPTPAYLLGIDVGRNGLGLVVLDGHGATVAAARRAFGHAPGEAADPQDWWRAARTGIKEMLRKSAIDPDRIRAVGLSGDSHGLAVVAKDGRSLCATVLGPDARCREAAAELARLVGPRNLANLTGGSASIAAAAAKLLLIKGSEKRVWHDLAWILAPKDFLRLRLTGVAATDAVDATATLLYNPKTRAWSKQIAQALGIDPAWLPPVVAASAMTGRITDAAAKECGLAAGTPVIGGAGHAAAVAVAAGALAPGACLVELGAIGSFMVACADEAPRDPSGTLRPSCTVVPGRAALDAESVAGADGLDWLMETVLATEAAQARRAGRDVHELLAELAAEVPPGASGCLHLPLGRAAGFLGLRPGIGRGHLVRAAFEGGALAALAAVAAAEAAGATIDRIIAAGPGAAGSLWAQILADILGRAVEVAPAAEAAATGVAILAAPAVGVHRSLDAAAQAMVRRHGPLQPRRAATEAYAPIIPRHRRLSAAFAAAEEPPPSEAKAEGSST